MNRSFIKVVPVFILLISVVLFAQDKTETKTCFTVENEKMDMGQMIRLVLDKNFDLQKVKYDAAMSDTDFQKFQKKYSVFLNAETGYKYSEYNEIMEQSVGSYKQKVTDGSVSVLKMFQTGTTLTAGVSESYYNVNSHINPPPTFATQKVHSTFHQPLAFAQVQQELLKNAFGYSDIKLQRILKNASEMKVEAMKQAMAGVVMSAIIDYWSLAIADSALDNANLKLKETIKVRNITNENVKLGLAESFESNYYNALVAGAESTQVMAKHSYDDAVKKFLRTINYDENTKVNAVAIICEAMPDIDEEKLIKTALAKRADYLNVQLALQNARMESSIYQNDALPSLTAQAGVQTYSANKSFGTAVGDTLSSDTPGFDVRLKMLYPLDDPEQDTNLRNSKLKLKLAELDMSKTEREIKDDVKSKADFVKATYDVYLKSKKASSEAQQYYNTMKLNLARGRFTAVQVKNALDAYVDSRQRSLEALVQHNVARLQLDIAVNQLFEKYGIDINKYIQASTQN